MKYCSFVAMWNEITPLTRRSAFHTRSVFHARSAFHKSRKGFISLKKALAFASAFFCAWSLIWQLNQFSEIFGVAEYEIMCWRTLWNISLRSMWNEIKLLTRRSAFHTRSVFHARSAFHKSRKGFISLKKALAFASAFFWLPLLGSNQRHHD